MQVIVPVVKAPKHAIKHALLTAGLLALSMLNASAQPNAADTMTHRALIKPAVAPQIGVQVKISRFSHDDAVQIRHAGFHFVRMGVWSDSLADPSYQQQVDHAFSNARRADLPVLLTIRSITSISHEPAGSAQRATDLEHAGEALGQTLIELQRKYASQLLAIEIWNEPDMPKYWPTGDIETTFAPYIHAVCMQLKTASLSTPILGFGFSRAPGAGTLPDRLLKQVIDAAPGCIDAVSYHAYGMSPRAIQQAQQDVLARYALPAVITEWGAPSMHSAAGLSRQAQRIADFLIGLRNINLPFASIYEWQDTPSDSLRERTFGLLSTQGTAKPALDAVRQALDTSSPEHTNIRFYSSPFRQ